MSRPRPKRALVEAGGRGGATINLTPAELILLVEALDSHTYWQLSDEQYRHDGYVVSPGSDNASTRRLLRAAQRLEQRLAQAVEAIHRRCCDATP